METIDLVMKLIGGALQLLPLLIADAPNKDEASRYIYARLRHQLKRNGLLEQLQAEDQSLLDARLPPGG